MKRKKLLLCFVIVFALFGGYNAYVSNSKTEVASDLVQANIEALAISEWDPVKGWLCFWDVQDDVSSSTFFICQRCGNCYTVSATSAYGADHCWH
ncbi:NVEALA domain-containing protein [Phocaeicola sp.]|uniref:NVEALA domain-containing protein n=1 Tax=Phocaeicola sp. TaxID=2773926 RepID=UPI0023BB2401|nr:NVEALA domain-containing protein [Phocaeicola sp.]MDE5678256.1 NVEALA domain-containing protein [Phocaeicola sp.]